MTGTASAVRALHVNDCAFTAAHLVPEAQSRGLPWSFQPVAASGRTWSGPVAKAQRAALGAAWLARLGARAARNDLLHVHSGSVVQHTRLVPKRFALHLHGTDIRSLQYDPRWQGVLDYGLRHAIAVFYSTPDLAAHAMPHRADATYVPVPIDIAELPVARPADGVPQVVIASRWEPVKGLEHQLETAERVARAVADRARVIGLDWGPAAHEARAVGVELVPTRPHADYLSLLAGATVVIGQAGGILSASELEAIGSGVPVVVPVPLPLYDAVRPPVFGDSPESAAEAAVAVVEGTLTHDGAAARAWVEQQHRPGLGVDIVSEVYDGLAANGWRAA
jgi:glycosyltransferase involved in cell wall biosynthesis